MTKPDTIPTDVQSAINSAVAAGLPTPTAVVAKDDQDPFIHLLFGPNDIAEVDAWARHVHARVGHDDHTYGNVDGPWHEYGTMSPDSRDGSWLGRRVLLSCQVVGRHPQASDGVQ